MGRKPSLLAAVVAGALGLAATPAGAQPKSQAQAPEVTLSESLQGPAKEAYEAAKLLVANHDFAGALAKFKEAQSLSLEPRLLYDMAVCEKNLRHYARMQALLRQYEHDAGAQMHAEDRALVDGALSAIQSLVAAVVVTVNEIDATVLVDGEAAGTTPLQSPVAVDLGRHAVLVQKAGFDAVERTFDAVGGQQTDLAVTLVAHPHMGHLIVASEAGAAIRVDGKMVAAGRFEADLPPGTHDVGVTEPGKSPYASAIDLRDGETRTVDVSLESEHHAALWPWIVGGAAVVAGGVVGGYFLFKPHDQSGPPPAGTLGTVFITSAAIR